MEFFRNALRRLLAESDLFDPVDAANAVADVVVLMASLLGVPSQQVASLTTVNCRRAYGVATQALCERGTHAPS